MPALLLHSLSEHREVIFGCLEAVKASRVVEVGSESGGFTMELAAWAAAAGAHSASIEPFPTDQIRELAATSESFSLVTERSPAGLSLLEPADAYLLDGDHTYWTVFHELREIARLATDRDHPLVVLHDVGWPCGRRDQYYAPDLLPPEGVHPHAFDRGVVPGDPGVVLGGFRGEGAYAVALHEGGPANGVLTAVEDYLDGAADLAYAHVPSVFGLGVIYSKSSPAADPLAELLAPYDRSPQLARLEANRLELLLRVISLQDALAGQDRAKSRLVLTYAERLAAVEAENTALRLDRLRLRTALGRDT
ncbi:MAG: class I SAM-dependent methyltransferase [Actinomycetota bacterium]|nr:class I SAM-dependent methyltransferase [Actinomycetota bacterium]